ncbi:MAG: ATP-dependent helicase, partial [Verrucomicrobiota bacterium]
VAEREAVLKQLAETPDTQRAYLLFDDYLEKLALRRNDFGIHDWWGRIQAASGRQRLEEVAMLFLRSSRSLPTELLPYANFEKFAEVEQSEKETGFVTELENWLLPPNHSHLDSPRAALRVAGEPLRTAPDLNQWRLAVRFFLFRSRSGEKERQIPELCELRTRAAHEAELFPAEDWQVIDWLHANWAEKVKEGETLVLDGPDLLTWLAKWAHGQRLELTGQGLSLTFQGRIAEFSPRLETIDDELSFTHVLNLPDGQRRALPDCRFFVGEPPLVLVDGEFFLVRNSPPASLLGHWAQRPIVPVRRLSQRLLTELRKRHARELGGSEWSQLCETHAARPQFVFELADDVVRLRLLARSDKDGSEWQWNGHEWQRVVERRTGEGRPELLDDPRLLPAIHWLQQLDWFTPEPGLWVGDANEHFLSQLAFAWQDRPKEADFLGNPPFQRLFLNRRLVKPKLVLKGSGIDWLSVSAEWEAEGMKLSPADLKRLAAASTRFVKLPDGGWVEIDVDANRKAQETAATLGLEGLSGDARKTSLLHATQLDEETLSSLGSQKAVAQLREKLAGFQGVPDTDLPEGVRADLRPYQKEGFDFLCNLTRLNLGGILADDM